MRGLVVMIALAFGCAKGGAGGGDDGDDGPGIDAPVSIDAPAGTPDAPPGVADARPPDAMVSTPDAPSVDAGFFCATTADCASMPGTCCFPGGGNGICVPGEEPIPGFCVPD